MVKLKRLWDMLAIIMVTLSCLCTLSCSKDDKEDEEPKTNPLVGNWLYVSEEDMVCYLLTFTDKETFDYQSQKVETKSSFGGTFTYNETTKKLILTPTRTSELPIEYQLKSVDDQSLIVTDEAGKILIFSRTFDSYFPLFDWKENLLTINAAGVKFKMIRVEGGTFYMGSAEGEIYEYGYDLFDSSNPIHSVTLSSFYIGETEVTQQLWQAVTGLTPTRDGGQWDNTMGLGSNRPAYRISWDDCQEFITKLNMLTGRTFRMPTDAEWEYAARGGLKSNRYKYAGGNVLEEVAWCWYNSESTHDVTTKAPNELGLYDMAGNVREWCSDWYSYLPSNSAVNPQGPSTGTKRVCRGGSCGGYSWDCSVHTRDSCEQVGIDEEGCIYRVRSYDLGLRLVLQ